MPWLAMPHHLKQVKHKFSIPPLMYDHAILFDPDGMVISTRARSLFSMYGAHAFPFTSTRISQHLDECVELKYRIFVDKEMPSSLMELLGEHVISFPDGKEVLTSELETKTAGLYFFEPTDAGVENTEELVEVWNSLTDEQRDDFKIVIINKSPFSLYKAKEKLKTILDPDIPWYVVKVCGRKLWRVFGGGEVLSALVVLKADKCQLLSYFACDILYKYRSDACPFTLEAAIECQKRPLQKLMPTHLLSPEAPLRRGGSSTLSKENSVDSTVSQIIGKSVLLLFATSSCWECGSFLPYENKGADNDFEIIYMSLDCDESPSSFSLGIQGMPWLVHAFYQYFAVVLALKLFNVDRPQLPAIVAFDQNGFLLSKESSLAYKTDYNKEYPFIQANMDEEVRMELMSGRNWYYWDLDTAISSFLFRW